ncbi:MAG: outer membrane lipoprotein-sorting protein [Polyangiaceae bacterium]|nr:outer membrane lipoprotein-sorting protein [Polyangiaceae bacterium]
MKSMRVLLLLLTALLLSPRTHAEATASARDILNRVDDLYRGRSAHGTMSMKVTHPNYERELVMEFWSQGTDKSLIRILQPKKERRTSTLKNGNNIWNYLPKVDRTIKIPSSMMGGSWMGSDFTNDDLVKEHRMAVDYDARFTSSSATPKDAIEITCTPKPNAPVVWGKVVVRVRRADLIPLQTTYYKENGAEARRLTFSDVRELGGRKLPTTMTMIPVDKPGHSTVVTYQELKFDVSLPANLFTVAHLRN